MGPIKTIKKKRSAEKKVDRNVLLAAATASASASAPVVSASLRSDDSSQPLDWWDGLSRRNSAEEMLKQKNVESVLFGGKRIDEQSNFEKLDWLAGELVLEHQRRNCRIAPTVAFKQSVHRADHKTRDKDKK